MRVQRSADHFQSLFFFSPPPLVVHMHKLCSAVVLAPLRLPAAEHLHVHAGTVEKEVGWHIFGFLAEQQSYTYIVGVYGPKAAAAAARSGILAVDFAR